jgi:O-antigen/teichoic acid export membrane protein
LIPLLGPAGAAIASVLCSLTMAAIAYSFARRRFPIPYDWSSIFGFVALAEAGVLVSTLAHGMHWPIRVSAYVVLSLAYPALAAAVLLRSSTERHRMLILWNKVSAIRKGRDGAAATHGNG